MEHPQYPHQQHNQLPLGWVETIDPTTGRTYYANATTGESSWDKPQQLPLPPPPPQYHVQLNVPYQQPKQDMNYPYSNSYNNSNDQTYGNEHPTNDSYATASGNQYHYPHYIQQQQTQQVWSTGLAQQQQQQQSRVQSNLVNNDYYDNTSNSNKPNTSSCDTNISEEVDPMENELFSLSAGQIADLCYLQQQQQQQQQWHHENNLPALQPPPYDVPLSIVQQQQRPRQEIGRLQTRYYALREQLKQFSNS